MIIYILFLNVLKYAMWTHQTTKHTLPRSVMRMHSAETQGGYGTWRWRTTGMAAMTLEQRSPNSVL